MDERHESCGGPAGFSWPGCVLLRGGTWSSFGPLGGVHPRPPHPTLPHEGGGNNGHEWAATPLTLFAGCVDVPLIDYGWSFRFERPEPFGQVEFPSPSRRGGLLPGCSPDLSWPRCLIVGGRVWTRYRSTVPPVPCVQDREDSDTGSRTPIGYCWLRFVKSSLFSLLGPWVPQKRGAFASRTHDLSSLGPTPLITLSPAPPGGFGLGRARSGCRPPAWLRRIPRLSAESCRPPGPPGTP